MCPRQTASTRGSVSGTRPEVLLIWVQTERLQPYSGKIPSRLLFSGVESIDPTCKTKVSQGESISNPSSTVLRSSPSILIVRIRLFDSLNRFVDPHVSSGQLRECGLSGPRAPCLRCHDRRETTRRCVVSTIPQRSPRGEASAPGRHSGLPCFPCA